MNAAINPLTALLRVPNGFLVKHEVLIDIMKRAAREVENVANAQGITLPYPDASGRALEVARATASNRSSMLQDVDRARQPRLKRSVALWRGSRGIWAFRRR